MPRPGQTVQSPSGVDVGVPPEDVVPHHVDDARRAFWCRRGVPLADVVLHHVDDARRPVAYGRPLLQWGKR